MKDKLIYFITITLSILFIFIGNKVASDDISFFKSNETSTTIKAKITNINSELDDNYDVGGQTIYQTSVIFDATILEGKNKGNSITAVQNIDTLLAMQPPKVEIGDKVLLTNIVGESEYPWIFLEYIRSDSLILLGIVFFIALILFGGLKGINTIISLVFTCLAVFFVFIPSILTGKNIYLWSSIICIFIIMMTISIVNGFNKKGFAAMIGCFSGVFVSGALTLLMDKFIKLTGMVNEESMYLQMLDPSNPIDLKAIIFAAIIIGCVGAIMDVSISIASSLMEVKSQSQSITFRNLLNSGINIGRDIMGTMSNTLILAYIGSSLSITLLLITYNNSFIELLNKELIIVEILQALVGSFGILLTIPLTSLVCAYLYTHENKKII